jgi:hypothetical protein
VTALIGLHDREAVALAAPESWIVDTVALSENPPPIAYDPAYNWITRLNFGYGSTGTLPLPEHYQSFAQQVAQYVNASSGCTRWIIGNEPNLSREFPQGQPIFPWNYASCFKLCRQAIHALPGHQSDEVLVAASGPWNDELKYHDNPTGDWILYFQHVLSVLAGGYDGYALHAYTHGYDPALVTSTARMAAPFQNRYYEFRTYQDYCLAVPEQYSDLPAYLTECNGNGPWQASGLMPAMLAEIDGWNASVAPQIACVVMYRYPHYDDFYIAGRGDVEAEYKAAAAIGYQSPNETEPMPPQPQPPTPTPDTPYPDVWDARLDARGCVLTQIPVDAGDKVWRVVMGCWFDEQESQGRHHIYVRVLGEARQLVLGQPVTVFWSSGSDIRLTERKSDPWLESMGLGAEYSLDFGMNATAPAYGVLLEDSAAESDIVSGCGLGSIEQPHYTIHTSYFFEIQLVTAGESPTPPVPTPTPPAKLIWPVVGTVTQQFGENPANYAQYGQAGHDGIDIACPAGSEVCAIADGVVAYTGLDESYGYYVRIYHESIGSHSFYAHLASILCSEGDTVEQGQVVALSGNTGNSTGAHLHFECRAGTMDAYHEGVTYGYTRGRYNPVDAYVVTGSPLVPGMDEEAV